MEQVWFGACHHHPCWHLSRTLQTSKCQSRKEPERTGQVEIPVAAPPSPPAGQSANLEGLGDQRGCSTASRTVRKLMIAFL